VAKMSRITIFNDHPAMTGDYSDDINAIALIECDDSYDQKALSLQGIMDIKAFTVKAKRLKFFCAVYQINH
jgi:hypothetical protein